MSSKILLKFLGGCLALFIVMGITTYKSEVQAAASGKTDTPASQIIAPVLERVISQEVAGHPDDVDRHTHITITNTGDTAVIVHVQFLKAEDGPGDCGEIDFFDTFTAQDTHVYSMDTACAVNDGADGSCPISISDRDGLLVITPVVSAADPTAIAFNHLHGVVHIFNEDDLDTVYRFNAVGRSAVDLATGALLPDGSVLDGAASGLETILPDQIIYHYSTFGGEFFSDLILVAISDVYGAVSGYKADIGTADYEASKVCNDVEGCISCDTVSWDCMDIFGINTTVPAIDAAEPLVCIEAGNPEMGLDQLLLNSAGADAVFAILGITTSDLGGASHTFVK